MDFSEAIDQIKALRAELTGLRAENESLRTENERLSAENEDLRRRLDEVERKAHRQAAPFRIEPSKRVENPKKPGRPKGHPGAWRTRPEQIDEKIEVALVRCPQCRGPLRAVERVEQFIEEIVPVRPRVTRLITYSAECPCCGSVRSTHPLQVSTATGAAGTHLGPRALGLGLELIHRHGLTRRKACAVLNDLCGLRITPGGLTHAARRLADKLRKSYDKLISELRVAPVVHADETSWWVGGPKWWLWVFTNARTTLYRVEPTRGRVVVTDTLGSEFPGLLISDCLGIYDDATPHQHKCYSHHLQAIKRALEAPALQAEARAALERVRAVLRAAMALKKMKTELPSQEWMQMRAGLEKHADAALAEARASPGSAKVAARLDKQRDHLFAFLDVESAEATNNHAERQLRPAVISRKVSCGNKTERGARTWEVLASLTVTCAQQKVSFLDLVAKTIALPSIMPQAR